MSDETTLRECPFCGSGWLYETRRNGYCDETPTMFCNSCKAVVTWEQVEEEGVNDETKAFVREHWNSRAELTCKVEVRESAWGGYTRHCGNCGADLDCDTRNKQNYCPNCGRKVKQ